ncbi:MAG: glycosyl hydrolase 53 family protein [Acidobacteriaceae bacterium]
MKQWQELSNEPWMCLAWRRPFLCVALFCLLLGLSFALAAHAQQPSEPIDISPIDGEMYYILNQFSGLQIDLNNNSATAGDSILQQNRSFTSLSQRWALTKLAGGYWAISNIANGLCLDSSVRSGTIWTVQNPCAPTTATQQWSLTATTNGYVTLRNHGTGLGLDVFASSQSAGASLDQSSLSTTPTQSQQWLLRPVFFRGIDNALLEKQESERVAAGLPWWQDAGQSQDVLQILKNHGVNMVRIRPTSFPPYNTSTGTTCTGNGCYTETDAADLDLAKRARQLGMSVELTLLFDGGSSTAIPAAWSGYTLTQAETAIYNYVKSEVEAYRSAGVMPDMVTIGNEVDTGFLGSLGSPTGSNFVPFAALEKQGMQAVLDAASDTSIGLPIPPPIRCIHITPAWDLTSFFGYVNSNSIPYDAICQSYYPIYHGPLTVAQSVTANPNNKPVEQTALTNAANALGKPIFLIEVGEHYESGFSANDPWYPATPAGQRQFLIDVDTVMKQLPNNLGMGIEYWDPDGVNIPKSGGGFTNGDGLTDAIYTWNGLTLFDNADTSGTSQSTAANYSALLPATDALGGRLDSTLAYKLVNVANGQVLETAGVQTSSGIGLDTGADTGSPTLHQQWSITSNGDGYFQIANRNVASGDTPAVLDNGGASGAGTLISANAAASGTASQEWNIVTAGDGNYAIVNKSSGLVLAASGSIAQQAPSSTNVDWITTANQSQQWKIIPVHISGVSIPAALGFDITTPTSTVYGAAVGTVKVDVEDSTGSLVLSSSQTVTLTISGPGGFSQSTTATSSNGTASFDLSSLIPSTTGTYTFTASSSGLTSTTINFNVTKATLIVSAQNATRQYGAANPAFSDTITGFVNGDTQSVVTGSLALSTTATAASIPGNYDITIQAGTLAAANYTFSFVNGTLTVTPASTVTTLTTSATTVYPGQSVSLTATVASAAGAIPAGTVTFFSGTTVLGTATLSTTGTATYTTTSLPDGANSITASYAGDADFNASISPAATVTEPGFSVAGNQTTLTISPSSSNNVALTLTPAGGYKGTVTMACSTTLPGVTCSFNPASYTLDGSNTILTGTATIMASSTAALQWPAFDQSHGQLLTAALFFFPGSSAVLLASFKRKKLTEFTGRYHGWILFLLLVGAMGLTACSGGQNSGSSNTPQPVTGVVTITASGSAGGVSQTVNLTVTVQ